MLAFIDTETFEVRATQTGANKERLTLVTSPHDLAKKFTLPQLQQLAEKIGSTPVPGKIAKDKVVPKLWRDLIAEAEKELHAEPEDLSDVQTPHADAVPDPVEEPAPRIRIEVPAIRVGKTARLPRPEGPESLGGDQGTRKTPGQRPRLKSFVINDTNVDLATLPPQAAIIAQGLLKEAKAGTTQMDHDAVVAFLDKLGLKTKQEPWRIFRYYHRNLELLGIIRPVTEDDK